MRRGVTAGSAGGLETRARRQSGPRPLLDLERRDGSGVPHAIGVVRSEPRVQVGGRSLLPEVAESEAIVGKHAQGFAVADARQADVGACVGQRRAAVQGDDGHQERAALDLVKGGRKDGIDRVVEPLELGVVHSLEVELVGHVLGYGDDHTVGEQRAVLGKGGAIDRRHVDIDGGRRMEQRYFLARLRVGDLLLDLLKTKGNQKV